MARLSLFQHLRIDGGRRLALEVDGYRCFEDYTPGTEEEDNALLWYIDVDAEGPALPTHPDEAVRSWFLDHSAFIQDQLERLADRLTLGFDTDALGWPAIQTSPLPGKETGQLLIRVSCMRRVEAREMNRYLRDLATTLDHQLRTLNPLVPAQ
jgi:hypothetical protein